MYLQIIALPSFSGALDQGGTSPCNRPLGTKEMHRLRVQKASGAQERKAVQKHLLMRSLQHGGWITWNSQLIYPR